MSLLGVFSIILNSYFSLAQPYPYPLNWCNYLIGHMANMFKAVWSVSIIFLKVKSRLSQHWKGETDMAAIVEVVKERNTKILPRRVLPSQLLQNVDLELGRVPIPKRDGKR